MGQSTVGRDLDPTEVEVDGQQELLVAPRPVGQNSRQLERENQRLQRELELLTAVAQLIVDEPGPQQLTSRLAHLLQQRFGVEQAMVGLVFDSRVHFEHLYRRGQTLPIKVHFGSGEGAAGWTLLHKRPYLCSDATTDGQIAAETTALLRCRTLLAVPILNHQRHVLGVIEVHNQQYGRPFSRQEVTTLQTIAQQAAPALERAQFYGKMEEWASAVANLLAFNAALNRQLEPEVLIRRLVEYAAGFIGAKSGLAGLVNHSQMVAKGYWHRGSWQSYQGCWSRQEGTPGWVLASECTYLTNDYGNDKLAIPQFIERFGVTSALCVPIMDAREEVLGFFELHNKGDGREEFTWSDAQFLESLANTAAIALRNGWLLTALEQREIQLRALAARNVSILEDERQRIARELHDEAGQALIGIKLSLQVLARKIPADLPALRTEADRLRQEINESTAQLKGLARKLRPPTLDQLGLQVATQQLINEFQERTAIQIHFVTMGDPATDSVTRLPYAVETACYRIMQEALTNVVRHANAEQVWIELSLCSAESSNASTTLHLSIRDDGRGFERKERGDGGLGLLGMQERILTLGGELAIETAPGQGVTIKLSIPIYRG